MKGHSPPLTNSYWRKFQVEDEEEAVKKALEASVKEQIVSFFVFYFHSGTSNGVDLKLFTLF